MYDIPFDRSFLQLSNGIRHVMSSTDRKLELTAKASMAQPVSQPAVCCNGLKCTWRRKGCYWASVDTVFFTQNDSFNSILKFGTPHAEHAK